MLACGCEGECCGICSLAAAAGRPRLTRANAAAWKYPSLLDFMGRDKATERNADDGEPTLWYWQMEGSRCAAALAPANLLFADRAGETSARYARAGEQRERQAEQERADDEQRWAETAAAKAQAKRSRVEQRRAAECAACSPRGRAGPEAEAVGDESEDDGFKIELSK